MLIRKAFDSELIGGRNKMFIERIEIENFKAISNMRIDFKPGINLLIGDNGVGKTSILDAIVVALGGYLNGGNL